MSKSLGTGMNPLALIEEHGADATRYGLMKMASSQDVTFSEGAIEEGRKLANKLWNARRLLILAGVTELDERPASLEERWILARLSATQSAIEENLALFDFAHLVDELYHLTFDDFCDWYLEAVKPRIYGEDADALATAGAALERLLKLLHPVMPHVTEEIWSNLPGRESRLIVAPWPEAAGRGAREARSTASRRRPSGSGEAESSRSSKARRGGSSTRSSSPSGTRRTGTSRPSATGSGRRSSGRSGCSGTPASPRRRRPTSCRPSGRSSSATGASSMRWAAECPRRSSGSSR